MSQILEMFIPFLWLVLKILTDDVINNFVPKENLKQAGVILFPHTDDQFFAFFSIYSLHLETDKFTHRECKVCY